MSTVSTAGDLVPGGGHSRIETGSHLERLVSGHQPGLDSFERRERDVLRQRRQGGGGNGSLHLTRSNTCPGASKNKRVTEPNT